MIGETVFEALEAELRRVRPAGRRLEQGDEDRLARSCFVLARFEELYRSEDCVRWAAPWSAMREKGVVRAWLELASPDVVDDLRQLSWLCFERQADWLGKRVALNPTFAGSAHVGGADADLVLDGYLIDIKTAVRPNEAVPIALYQLLRYTLLDYDDRYGIEAVGIYFATQGQLVRWPLERLMGALARGEPRPLVDLRREVEGIAVDLAPPRSSTIWRY
ncbi:MAG: hypothetical protein HY329_05450 [Chloroflexi bacterium]|nr:hypothetical protein [Chloroflexota bacterium]